MTSIVTESSYQNSKNAFNSKNNDSNNLLKLSLKKPKSWNWELTTSKSSPNISFPHIFLYDDKGNLLAETNDSDCIYKGNGKVKKTKNNEIKVLNRTKENFNNENLIKYTTENSTTNDLLNNKQVEGEVEKILKVEHVRSKSLQEIEEKHTARKYRKSKRSRSTNFSDMKETNSFLNDFISQLNDKGIDYKINRHDSTSELGRLKKVDSGNFVVKNNELRKTNVDVEKIPEVPILIYSAKGLIQRDLNAKEFDNVRKKQYKGSITSNLEEIKEKPTVIKTQRNEQFIENKKLLSSEENKSKANYSITKSKSALEIPTNHGNEHKRDKKKYRRNHSANPVRFSTSILERISEFKRRSSSTEDDENLNVKNKPKYKLRTSNAGTIVVCEESFRKVRKRSKSFNRINEYEENESYQERIMNEFEYLGNNLNNRYDKAIAGIDELIIKATSNKNENLNKKFSCCDNNIKSVGEFPKGKRNLRKLRRSVSANPEIYSSDSDDELNNRRGRHRQRQSATKDVITDSNNRKSFYFICIFICR